MSSGFCTKLSATQSTPMRRAKARSSRSLGVRAETGTTASGTATPLRSDSFEPLSTVTSAHSSVRSPTRSRTRPSSSSSSMPVRRALKISGCGICTRVASPGVGSRSNRIVWPGLTSISTSANRPSRSLGPCRSASTPSGRLQRQFGPAHGLQRRGVILVRAVAEVQAKDIDPGLGQGLDHAGRPAGGPQGGDDARASRSDHDGPVGRSRFPDACCANDPRRGRKPVGTRETGSYGRLHRRLDRIARRDAVGLPVMAIQTVQGIVASSRSNIGRSPDLSARPQIVRHHRPHRQDVPTGPGRLSARAMPLSIHPAKVSNRSSDRRKSVSRTT